MKPGPDKSARIRKVIGRAKAREDHPSLAQSPAIPGQVSEPDWMIDEDAELLLLALFGGKPWRYTPFEEIAEDCPVVWKRAVDVFQGDRAAARRWLETPSEAFKGKCPYIIALRVGGERRVLRALQRLSRSPG